MTDFPYKGCAVVTGGGSGIGLATATALAARGMDLALVDVREDRLEAARAALASNSRKVTGHLADVSDRAVVAELPARVAADHEVVSVLMNNAGVALAGGFTDVSQDDFDWLFEINFHAPVRLTRGFLPMLERCPRARIVNVSSLFGLIAPAGQTAYAASKFALRGFSEALRHELEDAGSPVGITTVHPGGIATSIARDARIGGGVDKKGMEGKLAQAERQLVMPPEQAAGLIVGAIERGRPRLIIGRDAKTAAAIQRLFPTRYFDFMRNQMSV